MSTLLEVLDVVYDALDDLFLASRFDEAEEFVRLAANDAAPMAVLLSLLTISLPWRNQTPGLVAVRALVVELVRAKAMSAAHANDILKGFL